MKKRLAVAFTGPSNSGKTTLIVKVAAKLMHEHGKEVAIIKNDPKDKARFDIREFTLPVALDAHPVH